MSRGSVVDQPIWTVPPPNSPLFAMTLPLPDGAKPLEPGRLQQMLNSLAPMERLREQREARERGA
jgi:hypothetical protein